MSGIGQHGGFWRELIPHAVWDGLKELSVRFGIGGVVAGAALSLEQWLHYHRWFSFIAGLCKSLARTISVNRLERHDVAASMAAQSISKVAGIAIRLCVSA